MLIPILSIIAILIGLFVVVAATRPADFRTERSAVINAPVSTVFEQVNDFHRWDNWSPWAKIDPDMAQTYEGAPSGKGAVYTWTSKNPKAGEGRMEILESQPDKLIRIALRFIKPFPANNTAEFILRPSGAGTEIVWAMFGKRPFAAKAFGLVMDMDKLVGGDFEKGLAQIKSITEAKA